MAKLLWIREQTVYVWGRQYLMCTGQAAGVPTREQAELAAARKRIAEPEAELAVHRRAAEPLGEATSRYLGPDEDKLVDGLAGGHHREVRPDRRRGVQSGPRKTSSWLSTASCCPAWSSAVTARSCAPVPARYSPQPQHRSRRQGVYVGAVTVGALIEGGGPHHAISSGARPLEVEPEVIHPDVTRCWSAASACK